MWYALGHIETPPPAPIVRLVKPASGKPLGAGSSAPAVTKGSVFEMPAGLPPFLKKVITVPVRYETSEIAAVRYVARQAGVPFSSTGPDYALLGTAVPFGKPVPVYEFLWYIGQSYVPGVIHIDGSGAVRVNNPPSEE